MTEPEAGKLEARYARLAESLPFVTVNVAVGEPEWRLACVQNQDALLDASATLEHFPFGFLLWESAVGLARFLAGNPEMARGRQVLEIGAGVGLPGLARALSARTLGRPTISPAR